MMVAELLPYFGILIIFQTLISTTGHIYILLEREKTFLYIGAVSAFLMVAAIIFGSFYSVKMIAISYTICYMAIIVPLHLYIGFVKTFGFSWSYIIKFWLPKITLGILLLISVLMERQIWLIGLIILFSIHLLYYQRNEFKQLKNLIINRITNNK